MTKWSNYIKKIQAKIIFLKTRVNWGQGATLCLHCLGNCQSFASFFILCLPCVYIGWDCGEVRLCRWMPHGLQLFWILYSLNTHLSWSEAARTWAFDSKGRGQGRWDQCPPPTQRWKDSWQDGLRKWPQPGWCLFRPQQGRRREPGSGLRKPFWGKHGWSTMDIQSKIKLQPPPPTPNILQGP